MSHVSVNFIFLCLLKYLFLINGECLSSGGRGCISSYYRYQINQSTVEHTSASELGYHPTMHGREMFAIDTKRKFPKKFISMCSLFVLEDDTCSPLMSYNMHK